jgi:hypothetical protein
MTTLTTPVQWSEALEPLEVPVGLSALAGVVQDVVADIVALALERQRATLRAATRVSELETDPHANTLAKMQAWDEAQRVTFFIGAQALVGARPVDVKLASLLQGASAADTSTGLRLAMHLVLEPLRRAVFDASTRALAQQARSSVHSAHSRDAVQALAAVMAQVQRDECGREGSGPLLQEERAALEGTHALAFDALVADWRWRLAEVLHHLPSSAGLTPQAVLADFDTRARALGCR